MSGQKTFLFSPKVVLKMLITLVPWIGYLLLYYEHRLLEQSKFIVPHQSVVNSAFALFETNIDLVPDESQ
jgi:hypothetical protein